MLLWNRKKYTSVSINMTLRKGIHFNWQLFQINPCFDIYLRFSTADNISFSSAGNVQHSVASNQVSRGPAPHFMKCMNMQFFRQNRRVSKNLQQNSDFMRSLKCKFLNFLNISGASKTPLFQFFKKPTRFSMLFPFQKKGKNWHVYFHENACIIKRTTFKEF